MKLIINYKPMETIELYQVIIILVLTVLATYSLFTIHSKPDVFVIDEECMTLQLLMELEDFPMTHHEIAFFLRGSGSVKKYLAILHNHGVNYLLIPSTKRYTITNIPNELAVDRYRRLMSPYNNIKQMNSVCTYQEYKINY